MRYENPPLEIPDEGGRTLIDITQCALCNATIGRRRDMAGYAACLWCATWRSGEVHRLIYPSCDDPGCDVFDHGETYPLLSPADVGFGSSVVRLDV